MKLVDVMTRAVEVISPEERLHEAARRMSEYDLGALPVCDGERLVGMITDRDLVIRSMSLGEDPRRVRVAEAMTYDVLWCFEDVGLDEVGRRMQERQVRRMVVLDRKKEMVGIVSLGDLARAKGNAPIAARTLEEIARPTKPIAKRPTPRAFLRIGQ
jgi:CBS domain-containing protein